jgi:type I restriction enzyme S subunit
MVGVLSFGRGLFDREPIENGKTSYKVFNRLKADHVVMSQLFGWEGALALSSEQFADRFLSPQFPTFLCDPGKLDREFLGWLMRRPSFWEDLGSRTSGMGDRRRTLNPEALFACEIHLPALSEQRRIVARIEELAVKIEEARELRRRAADEADSLLNAHLRATSESLAKRHGTKRLENLIADAGYGSSEKCSPERDDGAVPVLRIPNVASERVDLDNLKFTRLSARERERLLLSSGDVLVVRTNGSLELVGRSAVVDELPEPMAFASYMIRLRFNTAEILPVYAQRMLRHLRVSGQLIDFARTTAGQYNVSLGRLRSAEIPVPPLSEQRRIIAYLDDLQKQTDALRTIQAKTSTELDALMPSILDKAFRGEL